MSDMFRSNFNVNFYCSECGTLLNIDGDKSKSSTKSAYEFNSHIFIKPCEKCSGKDKKVKNLFKSIIKELEE